MSRLLPKYLQAIRARHPGGLAIKTFCESGTFRGATTRMALTQFPIVHTIELSHEWYQDAVRDLAPLGIHCHEGNSADVLPLLCEQITEPMVAYLDAHFFRLVPNVAGEQEGLPLWKELEALAKRPYRDIIIVDDAGLFGTPSLTQEWVDVSLERIAAYFPGRIEAAILHDQACVWRG